VNVLCGGPVAITSPVPQTTRNAIRGIVTRNLEDGDSDGQGQLVIIDTPGLHISDKKMNRQLSQTAVQTLEDTDLALYLLDASRLPGPEEEAIVAALKAHLKDIPAQLFVAINKIDLNGTEENIAAIRQFITDSFPGLADGHIFPISALKGSSDCVGAGTEDLLKGLFQAAPEGDLLYPPEYYTDQETSFRIAEVIRGEAVKRLREELPHAIYVEVADAELDEKTNTLNTRAFIFCERESQQGMIVGKGGSMVKAIRIASEKALNKIFDWKVKIDLRVKTRKDWRQNDKLLAKITG
jgi:GTP-binding protein Era